jgi:hypothetical protein
MKIGFLEVPTSGFFEKAYCSIRLFCIFVAIITNVLKPSERDEPSKRPIFNSPKTRPNRV